MKARYREAKSAESAGMRNCGNAGSFPRAIPENLDTAGTCKRVQIFVLVAFILLPQSVRQVVQEYRSEQSERRRWKISRGTSRSSGKQIGAMRSAAGKQENLDRTDTLGLVAILEEKREEVMADN